MGDDVSFFVYILASERNGTLYIGQTDDLWRRVSDHKAHQLPGFTAKYRVTRLVWYADFESREQARIREKQMKKWNRAWKLRLIEESNPDWTDLFDTEGMSLHA